MDKSKINSQIHNFSELYRNLLEEATRQIKTKVRERGGRISLFTTAEAWDTDHNYIAEQVTENTVILIINHEGVNKEMYPIDLLDNGDSVSIVFIDEYGDYPRIYIDDLDEWNICLLADFVKQC